MKTAISRQFAAVVRVLITPGLVVLALNAVGPTATAGDFMHNSLFDPSEGHLLAEKRGRVMIYDGLMNETVELAMNTQFDRIENMMFVGVRHTTEDGEEYADDDCD